MPRLSCSYAKFIAIIEAHDFKLFRHENGSHRVYKRVLDGRTAMVIVAFHRINDDIPIGTLQAMIRSSGLSQKLFR